MTAMNLRLCGVNCTYHGMQDALIEKIEESANEAYSISQTITVEELENLYNQQWPSLTIVTMKRFTDRIDRVLSNFGYGSKILDKDGQEIDLRTQTKELSLLICSIQNVGAVFQKFLALEKVQATIKHRGSYGSLALKHSTENVDRRLNHQLNRMQDVLEEIRPPFDIENAQIVTPALYEFLPKVLIDIVGEYMETASDADVAVLKLNGLLA